MAWPTTEIIDFVFIFVYALLLPFCLYNLIRHAKQQRVAFIVLSVFVILRIAGNAVLVAAYQEMRSPNVDVNTLQSLLTAGYIMQGIGYSFLIGVALRFYNRAIGFDWKQMTLARKQNGQGKATLLERFQHPSNIIDLLNLVALILLIVGLNSSISAFSSPNGGSTISATAKAGSYLYCALTAGLMAMYIYHLFFFSTTAEDHGRPHQQTRTARIILTCLLIASIPMAMRCAYIAYKYQSGKIVNANVWIQMVFQYIAEVITVAVFIILGFRLHAAERIEMETSGEVGRMPLHPCAELKPVVPSYSA